MQCITLCYSVVFLMFVILKNKTKKTGLIINRSSFVKKNKNCLFYFVFFSFECGAECLVLSDLEVKLALTVAIETPHEALTFIYDYYECQHQQARCSQSKHF